MDRTAELKHWYRCGFKDGWHGNEKWPPDDIDSRKAYLDGFKAGRAELRAEQRS